MLLLAAGWLVLTRAALRYLGVRRWQTTLARFSPPPRATPCPSDDPYASLAARCVGRAARRVAPGDTCLSQAVVLWWLLRLRGLDSELRLGVCKTADQLRAHAWIDYRGVALGLRSEAGGPFVAFPGSIFPSRRFSA